MRYFAGLLIVKHIYGRKNWEKNYLHFVVQQFWFSVPSTLLDSSTWSISYFELKRMKIHPDLINLLTCFDVAHIVNRRNNRLQRHRSDWVCPMRLIDINLPYNLTQKWIRNWEYIISWRADPNLLTPTKDAEIKREVRHTLSAWWCLPCIRSRCNQHVGLTVTCIYTQLVLHTPHLAAAALPWRAVRLQPATAPPLVRTTPVTAEWGLLLRKYGGGIRLQCLCYACEIRRWSTALGWLPMVRVGGRRKKNKWDL
jgi:hypothetical protein